MSQAPSSRIASLSRYYSENGLLRLLERIGGGTVRRLRDRSLAAKLGCKALQVGRFPKILGLRCIRVGNHFRAGDALWLEAVTHFAGVDYTPQILIGDNVGASDQVHIGCTNRVTIGDGVLLGSRVLITDHAHGQYAGDAQSSPATRPALRRLSNDRTVTIGRNVWIGDGAAILGGAEIGEGSIIGANAVVSGPIPPNCIAVGAPARPIRSFSFETNTWIKWDGK